ncbi:MAG: FAD-dependent oxidoreductase, partial [Pseudomonadota bacterium]|nr:FAD-dependent oxidoreductase [Pseudomonadota bacterium]
MKSASYWLDTASTVDTSDHTPPSGCVDVVVIGGGFTGFGAAIPLARAGLTVLVLEAAQIGSGASTRNGGITSGNIRLS